MFHYSYDPETGGLLLNDETPNSSKEPRPVYAAEMLLLHMDEMWRFDIQNDAPYMWAEAASYYYRGILVAKAKGGSLCQAPDVQYQPVKNERGKLLSALPYGTELQPVDIAAMVRKNAALMAVIEQSAVKKIYSYYRRYQKKLDCFHVAFSGGKDSVVLLELVKKALPHDAFKVVFGDTGMEFPDTYRLVDAVEEQCRRDEIAFYRAASHFDPHESWRIFGPPSRTLRWCCTVHKAAPQTLKLREIVGQDDYKGAVFLGVRAHESIKRSKYDFEEQSKKQQGQKVSNPILDWTSCEIWMYIYSRNLPFNGSYKKGNTRAGCLFCPQGEGKPESFRRMSYPGETQDYMNLIADTTSVTDLDAYVNRGGWIGRKDGKKLSNNPVRYREEVDGDRLKITMSNPSSNWREWMKTLDNVPFQYQVLENGDSVTVYMPKAYDETTEGRLLKQVFHKSAYCVACRACESNCSYGCIHFENGLKIENCRHCLRCHQIDDGCLAYASLQIPATGGKRMPSLNVFNDHAPKPEWVVDFFERGDAFLTNNSLGPDQDDRFKRFLRHSALISDENKTLKTTPFFTLVKKMGVNSEAAWGLIYTQLAYANPQIKWYIDNMPLSVSCSRQSLEDSLTALNLTSKVAQQIVRSYKRLCGMQLGTVLHFGTTVSEGKKLVSLTRTPCAVRDPRVILYALYRYAEACGDYYEFTLSHLMDTANQSGGVSPVKLFGLTEDELSVTLRGLSAQYPDFINATFTHGLNRIVLYGPEKKSEDMLKLFP